MKHNVLSKIEMNKLAEAGELLDAALQEKEEFHNKNKILLTVKNLLGEALTKEESKQLHTLATKPKRTRKARVSRKKKVKLVEEQVVDTNTEAKEIDNILEQRGSTYGDYDDVAQLTINFVNLIVASPSYNKLSAGQKQALFFISNKLARILNGDPNYADSWTDISGYAELVVRSINKKV